MLQGAAALFSRNSPAKVDTHAHRGPLLITAGTKDHTVPLKPTREAFRKYAHGPSETRFHEFDGRGHSLTLDHGWKDVATVALNWLASKRLLTAAPYRVPSTSPHSRAIAGSMT